MSRTRSAKSKNKALAKQKKMRNVLIAVYDGFREKGCYSNNLNFIESELIGEYFTEPIYKMYMLNRSHCAIEKDGQTSVKMEVYRITESLMHRIEVKYGYKKFDDENNIFNKELIKTPYGFAFTFIANKLETPNTRIYEGDWIEHLIQQSTVTNTYKEKEEKEITALEKIFNS